MIKNKISWMIGGEAGYGIMAAGTTFAKACSRGGLHVFINSEFPSLIKGGHNLSLVRVDEEEIFSHLDTVDLLVALNQETIDLHLNEIVSGGGIIFDGDQINLTKENLKREDIVLFPVPLTKIVRELGAELLLRNTVVVGASMAILNYDFGLLEVAIRDSFGKKKGEIVEQNVKAARMGYDYVKKNICEDCGYKLEPRKTPERMLLTGNDAIAMGAIKAGCKFYAAYPMTPVSAILHTMAEKAKEFNIVVKQTEDEIAAMNMIIGAGFAGVRSMNATSGGGFSLMVEALGLAAMTETPIVTVEGQRPGPSTGQPTHTSQGDLKFLLSAGQGEFVRILIAPGDREECFYETFNAFNLAEKFQVPVLIQVDKFLAEDYKTTELFDQANLKIERGKLLSQEELNKITEYKRYLNTVDGISPRALPGQLNGVHCAPSTEHDEAGFSHEASEALMPPETAKMILEKRMRKLNSIEKEIKPPKLYGPADADVTLVSWGSTKGPIFEAMKLMEKDGVKVNFLQILYLSPFPTEEVKKVLSQSKTAVDVENNFTAQLASLIREKTGIEIQHKILKYDGRPFYPSFIYKRLKDIWNIGK
ncbi:MAG TPA: 2-oxoacid:acceptor oxidoreductase subunit alpha [Terriglobales bacterium]|nr:2-oxoacid:acceptor oxidoreductase subunit alpha [Terriglobales bacterium]